MAALSGLIFLTGCHTDMWIQNKVDRPLAPSKFFPNGQSARPLVPHSIARGHFDDNPAYYTGIIGGTRVNVGIMSGNPVETGIFRGKYVDKFPFPMTADVLKRGENRFNIFCAPCHSRIGDGQGMIAIRGFNLRKKPANYNTERLRNMPVGHFYDVITNGYGVMYSYAERIPDPRDRWAIVGWIRVLQLSQHAPVTDVPKSELNQLAEQKP
jgi:hypothetical protein